eukprot:CAMPEP_0167778180 /NCGR_PEP_ID=MMETSP0111_2-20121227/4110_1 /TAXON_ID=91324 /ORGANISM="Lotharella globosa, Strain CCCM811" /LENGTH=372 /DNA_ID=CAMNT_0007668455 /DNA_START=62 /DNA_END=1180 /DNA_ORIENTATION=+
MNNRKPSLLTQGAFMIAGLSSFTKQAYEKASALFDHTKPPNLDGRVFMVTGANSGIGYAATKAFLTGGGTVHMACRSQEKAATAREQLLKETGVPSDRCHVHIVDMSSVRQIKAFARTFCKGRFGARLDCVVNNAGCMHHKPEKTPEGNERNFATNTLGTFVLTEELLPILQKTPKSIQQTSADPARVITVSSGGAYTQKLDVKDLQTKSGFNDGTYIYAQNKRQQVALTEKWGRISESGMPLRSDSKSPQRKVVFQSMHPGWVDTPTLRASMPDFYNQFKSKLRKPDQGADTIVWLATSKESLNHPQGSFFLDRKAQSKVLWGTWTSNTEQEADQLYTHLQALSKRSEPSKEFFGQYENMLEETSPSSSRL